jgi:hypothetical protein
MAEKIIDQVLQEVQKTFDERDQERANEQAAQAGKAAKEINEAAQQAIKAAAMRLNARSGVFRDAAKQCTDGTLVLKNDIMASLLEEIALVLMNQGGRKPEVR